MKTLYIIILAILLCPVLHAEPPAKLDGLAGIPFGSTVDQVKAAMDARGAVFHPNASTGAHLEFVGGSFNNEKTDFWHFLFFDGKLYKAAVVIPPEKGQRLQTYERVKKAITEKYGKPFQQTTVNVDDAQLNEMLSSGKIVLEANWHMETPGSRSIACKLIKRYNDVIIRIIYQDDAIDAQVVNKQKDDI